MPLTEKDIADIDTYIKASQLNTQQMQNDVIQQDIDNSRDEKSMIAEQLDLGEELERIDYLLRGFTLTIGKDGIQRWTAPTDKDMVVLSEYGVHLIRNTIAWYLNKNTLLSNYDEETINHKMEDFASDLNDTIFMEYEKVFQYPTLEECKDILTDRLQKKKELKVFSLELIGKEEISEEKKQEIEEKILNDIEPIIEKELTKIKEQIIKNKLKRFLIIMREVQDAVHSTYLRAWKGQERTTLRQHIHISENKGGYPMPQQQRSSVLPFSLLRRNR